MPMLARLSDIKGTERLSVALEPVRSECIYVYMDLLRYGIKNPSVSFWADDLDAPGVVGMRYHNGMHVWSRDPSNVGLLAPLVVNEAPAMVLGTGETVGLLARSIEGYKLLPRGAVMSMEEKPSSYGASVPVDRATRADVPEIAALVLSDEGLAQGYSFDELVVQTCERQDDGYCRAYVIREAGRIVAHAATGAEGWGIATVVDVVVSTECRRRGLGARVTSALCADLLEEGLRPHLFCYSKTARNLYSSLGFKEACSWSKLARK